MSQEQSSESHSAGDPVEQERQSRGGSSNSSARPSRSSSRRPHSHGREPRTKGGHRVRFTPGGESLDDQNQKSYFDLRGSDGSDGLTDEKSKPAVALSNRGGLSHSRHSSGNAHPHTLGRSHPPAIDTDVSADITETPTHSPVLKPRPSMIRENSANSGYGDITDDEREEDQENEKNFPQREAEARAQRLSWMVGSSSAPGSRTGSRESSPAPQPRAQPPGLDGIPMRDLEEGRYRYQDEDTDEDEEAPMDNQNESQTSEAHRLVRAITKKVTNNLIRPTGPQPGLRSGQVTPEAERDPDYYVPKPTQYRESVLSSLLKFHNVRHEPHSPNSLGRKFNHIRQGSSSSIPSFTTTPGGSPDDSSGRGTPREKHDKWYYKSPNQSTTSLAGLMDSSSMLAAPGAAASTLGRKLKQRPAMHRPKSTGAISQASSHLRNKIGPRPKPKLEDEIRITVHIAETLSRQKYMLKLCRALMTYGAPTHRLEEYMRMTARVLEIESQFLYIPGCMIMSFDDASTHTTEVKLVRATQGVDLGKLRDTHEIYKEVVHDKIGVEEATQRLDEVIKRKQKHHKWTLVLIYGLASAFVGPFAFKARLLDIPIAFLLGCLLGFLQLIIAPSSELYANVFEITAAIITSFLARAFGSIRGDYFCFSALAQSSIALILPGYTVLCGSLELQSRSIVAGSVRMVYAIIYSLFLGFGITIGTALYGLIDDKATSETSCSNQLSPYYGFLFVPAFTMCLVVINQAKWKQAPVMLIIAFVGYTVNFFSARRFAGNAQIANTLGAFIIGVLGNLYSRLRHGVAAAALLPAIFVQVPSGLAASGSLVSGITSANQITANATGNTTVSGATNSNPDINSMVFNVGYSMIQVAIGITVGLFLSALVVYPLGKRRSGLFSF
ncbi:MAG: hypothetical protein M1812_006038 [Candelaria pacifica]|nr:MAG: hypothetical protein M1812_006038 [Candelaria pacifica]